MKKPYKCANVQECKFVTLTKTLHTAWSGKNEKSEINQDYESSST